MSSFTWHLDAKLSELNIPHLELVLDEIFGIAGSHLLGSNHVLPLSLNDLVKRSGIKKEEVFKRLGFVATHARNIEISPASLFAELEGGASPFFLNLCDEDVSMSHPFSKSARPSELVFDEFICTVKEKDQTLVTFCPTGEKSFSGALYLKQQGVINVRSLQGGLVKWAEYRSGQNK